MTKIVYNADFGGFGLSDKAMARIEELGGVPANQGRSMPRTDPLLVQVVEELGEEANGRYATLQITELPAGTLWRIEEYDGRESVETPESYAWEVA